MGGTRVARVATVAYVQGGVEEVFQEVSDVHYSYGTLAFQYVIGGRRHLFVDSSYEVAGVRFSEERVDPHPRDCRCPGCAGARVALGDGR